jgi:HK97 family phage major capsid protein
MSIERILEIRREKASLKEEGDGILDKAEASKRGLSAAENDRIDKLIAERKALDKEEDRLLEVDPSIIMELGHHYSPHRPDPNDGMIAGGEADIRRPATDRSYRGLFYPGKSHVALDRADFQDFDEFLNLIASDIKDSRMEKRATMVEGTPSLGGFEVPEEFGAFLLDKSLESEIVRPRASLWAMKEKELKIPAWDGADHTSDLYGGLSGTWLAENATATRTNAKLRQVGLNARKLGIYAQASRELVQDGIGFESQLSGALTGAINWFLDYAFLQGTGAGQPLGVLNDQALIEVSKETEQQASTILFANVLKMWARLAPSCMAGAVWIINQTAIPQLMTMTVAVGTGGALVPAVQSRAGIYELLYKPIIFTEKVPALGSKGDIILADLSQYAIGMRQEVVIDKSNAPGWTEDSLDFRVILRADGAGTWSEAITPKNGDSLSWAVVLEDRT